MSLLNPTTNPFDTYSELGNKCKSDLINEIIDKMSKHLTGQALLELNKCLNKALEEYEVFIDNKLDSNENYQEINQNLLELFIKSKEVEGLSPKSLNYYKKTIQQFLNYLIKPLPNVVAEDIRGYMNQYKSNSKASNCTMDNIRRIFNSFFTWITDEGYLLRNPMKQIKKVKAKIETKKAYSPLEIELMRDTIMKTENELQRTRNIALFELLLSSGCRVGEIYNLNIEDINMDSKEFFVTGKGNRERICYFNDRTKYRLKHYIECRKDNNSALFVSLKKPYRRFLISGIERMIRNIGLECGVTSHPHKFRRTFATNLAQKGVPIVQIQKMLGHANIDTTQLYIVVNSQDVQYSHQKYVG